MAWNVKKLWGWPGALIAAGVAAVGYAVKEARAGKISIPGVKPSSSGSGSTTAPPSSPPRPSASPSTRVRTDGAYIGWIQRSLILLGYGVGANPPYIVVNGVYANNAAAGRGSTPTAVAIRAFQSGRTGANGRPLTADG